MNKTLLLVLTGTLAFSAEGCSYMSEFVEKRKEIENSPTISTTVKASASQQEAESSESQEESIDSEQAEAVKRTQNVAKLIPSTDPSLRIKNSIRGRQDPFAIISVKPTVEIKEEPKAVRKNTIQNRPQPRRELPPSRVRRPREINSTPTIETMETTPKANLAENVLITGLVQFGDRLKIILQAPEETSSRYVEVGQYVSNGQVLVKRIDPSSPTPIVVLEQDGIEVTKVVGQTKEETTEEKASISSSLPLSWLSNQ